MSRSSRLTFGLMDAFTVAGSPARDPDLEKKKNETKIDVAETVSRDAADVPSNGANELSSQSEAAFKIGSTP